MSEFQQSGSFIGASRRCKKGDEEKPVAERKYYLNADFNVVKRQDENSHGQTGAQYDCDPGLWPKLKAMPVGTPVTVYLEEFEWTKEGVTQSRKTVVGVVPVAPGK